MSNSRLLSKKGFVLLAIKEGLVFTGQFFEEGAHLLIQPADRQTDIPFCFIPFSNVIGNSPELEKGNFLLQANIV
jgi:hypothetical protein